MAQSILLDAAPDPGSMGVVPVVVLLVMGLIVPLAVGLVLFLWYRKRSLRGVEMIRPDLPPTEHTQPSNPNQP